MPNLNSTLPAPPPGCQNVIFQADDSTPTNVSAYVPLFVWTVNGQSPALTVLIAGTPASFDNIVQFNSVAAGWPITI
jgi:hypothetical protein